MNIRKTKTCKGCGKLYKDFPKDFKSYSVLYCNDEYCQNIKNRAIIDNGAEVKPNCKSCGIKYSAENFNGPKASYCNNIKCQEDRKIDIIKEYGLTYYNKITKAQTLVKKNNDAKNKSIRKCKKCKKNAYPNFFYCPTCHKTLSIGSDFQFL